VQSLHYSDKDLRPLLLLYLYFLPWLQYTEKKVDFV
jgi:hypothetical protein